MEWDGCYRITEAKRALSPSGLPGIDYALNPYGGCEHGCVYCYAPEVLHTDWKDWRVVKVRTNIPERLAKELSGLEGTIGIGTVTDPYQYAEKRFRLTQRCLEILKERDFRIHLHTKSDLILRDIELISSMRGEVGITITTLSDKFSKITEPGAPLPGKRLDTLRQLSERGIDTYALIGPVLDHLDGNEEELVEAIVSTGVERVFIDRLNPRPLLTERLNRMNIRGSERPREKIRKLAAASGLSVSDVF
ncbi:MAG: radical SAM protein [Methanomassiliicoccaceae archaeon]|nr:radical SAM protein [Methanomassiliicoccaceae archaeon]